MTTNVYDIQSRIIASDSRWSYRLLDGFKSVIAVVYADDTGFDKIEVHQEYCAIFAGNSKLIDDWKNWIRCTAKHVVKRPIVIDDFAMCLIDKRTGAVKFEHGQKISDEKSYRFAGTGAYPAYKCWNNNKDALRAVESAKIDDHYSGGEVKFLTLEDDKHNVNHSGVFESINSSILTRGMVMYTAESQKLVPIQEAAKSDKEVRKLVDQIASGSVSAEAPSGLDTIVWTESDVERLDAALEECFGPIAK